MEVSHRRVRSLRVAGLDNSLRAPNRPGANRQAAMPTPNPMARRSDGDAAGQKRAAVGPQKPATRAPTRANPPSIRARVISRRPAGSAARDETPMWTRAETRPPAALDRATPLRIHGPGVYDPGIGHGTDRQVQLGPDPGGGAGLQPLHDAFHGRYSAPNGMGFGRPI